MVTCRCRPQLRKSRERGLNCTFESRHWSAGITTVLRAVRQYVQKSWGPGQPETKRLRRLVARVSQLPLAVSRWQFRVFQTLPVSSLFGDNRPGAFRPCESDQLHGSFFTGMPAALSGILLKLQRQKAWSQHISTYLHWYVSIINNLWLQQTIRFVNIVLII